MTLDLKLALQGNLRRHMEQERRQGATAVTRAMTVTSGRAKQRLRDQVTGAGMSRRLANTWRSAVYPRRRKSINAAALVYSKAKEIIRSFDEGSLIRSRNGFFLAIPTDAVPRRISYNDPVSGVRKQRQRPTPRAVEQGLGLPLRFVYGGPGQNSFLITDKARKSKKTGKAKRASKRALAKKQGEEVVMFILVPQVRMPKRLNINRVARQAEAELPSEIVNAWARQDRR